jgi:hypothetical protein
MTAPTAQAPSGAGVRLSEVSCTIIGIDMAAARKVDVANPSGGGVVYDHRRHQQGDGSVDRAGA